MNVSLMLAALVFGAQAPSSTATPERAGTPGCRPYAGLEQLWSKQSLRWIVVGEMHGTWEMPSAFRDLVCNASAAKRPIVVAVERSETEQADIDAYMKSDGGRDAQTALLQSGTWRNKEMQDGRGSRAYLHLLNNLRVMQREGKIQRVLAFQPHTPDRASYEAEMAKRLRAGSPTQETLVLAFVGNCHAMRIAMCGSKPAAAFLPPTETFTINLESSGGTAWNCAPTCGAHKIGGPKLTGRQRLEFLNDPKAPYDAMLFLEGPVSASPPAAVQVETAAK